MTRNCTHIPPELVEEILSETWATVQSPEDRTLLMTTLPFVNHVWKGVYARISSRDIHIPSLQYFYYLCRCIRSRKSLIYETLLSERCLSITCLVDFRQTRYVPSPDPRDSKKRGKLLVPGPYPFGLPSLEVYNALACLPDTDHLLSCFPHLKYICLETITFTTPPLYRQRCSPLKDRRFSVHTRILVQIIIPHNGKRHFTLSVAISDAAHFLDPSYPGSLNCNVKESLADWSEEIERYINVMSPCHLIRHNLGKIVDAMARGARKCGKKRGDVVFAHQFEMSNYMYPSWRNQQMSDRNIGSLNNHLRWATESLSICESFLGESFIVNKFPVSVGRWFLDFGDWRKSLITTNDLWISVLYHHVYEIESWSGLTRSDKYRRCLQPYAAELLVKMFQS